ncbi:MAG TPA: PKD domain-containing protein, partial [Niastella sp.]
TNAVWQWNFSNGNSSSLENPAAIFNTETTYTITLTVADGTQISTKTKIVTVYKRPVIDFTITPDNGCTPLNANLTGIVSAGDGTISSWKWDFGDGSIQQTATPNVNHIYRFKQTASISVTAMSNYGCSGTKLKENIVVVKDSVHAAFSAGVKTFCAPNATVQFTNTSTGASTLTYNWDFGDGNSSSAVSPTHTYTTRGIYTVKLTVASSEGCTVSKIENDYINVGSFVTDFSVPAITCQNRSIEFKNTSTPKPTQSNWYVNGSPVTATSDTALKYTFPTTGTYTLRLVNNFDICQQEITKQVEIKSNPKIDTFIIDHAFFCNAPYTVNFRDTSSEAVRWRWNFNYYYGSSTVNSTTQNATNVYSSDGTYNVHLEIDNAYGCTSFISKWIKMERVNVYIVATDTVGVQDCDSLTKKFKAQSTDPIVNYLWKFGDGATSTDATPEHTYRVSGEYYPTLTYTTAGGCTGTVKGPWLLVMQRPKGDFTVTPEVCGHNYVHITTPVLSGYFAWVRWDWGDGTGLGWANPSHQYKEEGVYTIKMVLYNGIGTCNDTIIKNNIIRVKGPFPRIHRIDYTCDGARDQVAFIDSTTFNDKWTWDFGDGSTTTYTTYQPVVNHTYPKSWNFRVKLTTQKDNCVLEENTEVYILKKQNPVLSLDNGVTCINEPTPFHIRGLEQNLFILSDPMPRYIFKKWEYADGTPFNGNWSNNSWTWYMDLDGKLTVKEIKKDSIRMIMTSYFHNCEDTTNYVPIKVNGVTTSFDVLSDNVCFKSPVVLQDRSVASVGNTITSWTWNFGDGQQLTTSQAGVVNHYYSRPGRYIVTLTASDADGCVSSVTNSTRPVTVLGVKAEFAVSPGTTVAPNSPIQFTNNSQTTYAGTVTWEWRFGDGIISADESPVHAYTTAATYTVMLIATDNGSNCRDTATMLITCVPEQTVFTTNTIFIGEQSACPPVQASFAFSSNIPYDSLVWNFGDGFFLKDQTHPNHIYTMAKEYIVTLQVYNQSILMGTHRDTILVSTPPSALAADDLAGCIGDQMTLYSSVPDSGYNYTWDFGNGIVTSTKDTMATNTFLTPGTFSPRLVVRNAAGCASSVKLANNIIIYSDPVISILPATAIACKGNGVQLQASGGISYVWSPGTDLSNNLIPNPIAHPSVSTNYSVQATDANGCKGAAAITVIALQPFTMQATPEANICKGDAVQLTASGATSYQWINNITGLNNTGIGSVVARPEATTTYTVVGYDQYQCYSDTIDIPVTVRPSPTVWVGNDRQVTVGTTTTLQSTGSPDIVRWQWSPADYLSCTGCQAPVSAPRSSIEYVLKVYNQFNCEAADTIRIKALCEENVGISNAFTPNNDGNNDAFMIPSKGVSKVIFFRIFNRWGEVVFEKKDYVPDNVSGAWDGKYKGINAPEGIYVYFTEMECLAGIRFQRKGTIMLIR